jgi:hypothetical protein
MVDGPGASDLADGPVLILLNDTMGSISPQADCGETLQTRSGLTKLQAIAAENGQNAALTRLAFCTDQSQNLLLASFVVGDSGAADWCVSIKILNGSDSGSVRIRGICKPHRAIDLE